MFDEDLRVLPHKIIVCSCRILSFKRGCKDLYVRTSTFLPKASSKSILRPTGSSRLFPSSNSTRISISLSSLSSPLAKEPKTEALLIP
jgi:hypothetical protein